MKIRNNIVSLYQVTEQDILLLDRKSLLISSTLAAYNTSTELVVTHSDDVEQVKDEPDSVHESDNGKLILIFRL